MRRTQGSLEYIIIIGGVIILAAATYFMLKGFSQTTGAGTTETIGVAGEKYMLELENLGRSETRFSAKKWANPLLQKRTLMEFSSLGDVTFNATNLTAHGVQVSSLEFDCFGTGFCELNHTIAGGILTVHTAGTCCTQDFDLYMFYNNLTALINPCLANYTGPPRISCGTIPLPDSSPPTVNMSSAAFGSSGSVVDADITVTVNGTGSNVSEVYYSIDGSPYFKADNLYYGYQGMSFEGHPHDGSYNSDIETIHIIATVPSEDNYTVRILARDEYGNEATEEENVSIEIAGSPVDLTPPAILSTEPANNTLVNQSLITLTITTNEVAHCRFSLSSATAYSSMTDFNTTDSTQHNITNIALTFGENYKYYFKCNDTSGNVNPSDYVLNFTRKGWAIIRLTNNTSADSSEPDIAVEGDNVHVVWWDERGGNKEVYYKNSSDGGITWSDYYIISNASGNNGTYHPRIGVNGNNLHVVWEDTRAPVSGREIYYTNSSDGGITWSDDYKISQDAGAPAIGDFRDPEIAVAGTDIHVVWHNFTGVDDSVFYINSSDGGVTWGSDYLRLGNESKDSQNPSIAADGNEVHIVWGDGTDIGYINSSDGGVTWGTNITFSNATSQKGFPFITVNGSYVRMVWMDAWDTYTEVLYKESTDGGETWSDDHRLTYGSFLVAGLTARIAVNGNNVHVVWTDLKDMNDGEIYYIKSSDGGSTWSSQYQLTNDSSDQYLPEIAVSGDNVYMVWEDQSYGAGEIYFAHYGPG